MKLSSGIQFGVFLLVLIIFICPVNALTEDDTNHLPNISKAIEDPFDFIQVEPFVQIIGEPCSFTVVLYPARYIASADIKIYFPNESSFVYHMGYSNVGKYMYSHSFDQLGKYYFKVIVNTKDIGSYGSNNYSFWIVNDTNDLDNDGMPGWWEKKYGFNPESPLDAIIDADNDGYNNYEEYVMRTHPLRKNIIENAWFELREDSLYFLLSLILFLILFSISLFGIRREQI